MFKKWFDPSRKELKRAKVIVDQVLALEETFKNYSDETLKNNTRNYIERFNNGETLESLMIEAFANVKEASTRVLGLTPYPVQIMGAFAIFNGNIAEMKTGEGKTLTAVLPAYLSALNGEGVHIVTVNEYLAKREAEGEIGDLFRFLGLTVGLNLRELTQEQKQAAYDCDILYSTNSELGFDYLRDHMVPYAKMMVAQRGLNFAIIDEVDSILIDEARTPLIISGGEKHNQNLYMSADKFAKSLRDDEFEIDIETKTIELTPVGVERAEKVFQLENLYDLKNVSLVHHINNALRANHIMARNVEYMVQNNEVLIIDQFTGRIMAGRQFSEGLHQALEAKENVTIKKETITVATITYQNFFRMYKKLSGMTGTAKTEEQEFRDIYNMNVIEIPTNKPIVRIDANDYLFATLEEKYEALIKEVKERHETGQPILLGTVSVETSELLSSMLRKERIVHEVLNAKNHEREAEIVAKAGLKGSVTIATNMAGRGTDIKLGEGVVELGGLAVIGSERHESRRIDNQLRGRSGRQGDPGFSRFYLSAEDELLERFGGETFKRRVQMIQNLNKSDEPLSFKIFSNFIAGAQKRIEANNYDNRKNVLKYDDVIRRHREVIYKERREILTFESVEPQVLQNINKVVSGIVNENFDGPSSLEKLYEHLDGKIYRQNYIDKETFLNFKTLEEVLEFLDVKAKEELADKRSNVPDEIYEEALKSIMLRIIDTNWMRHIDQMSALRQSASLQAYGQQNPLVIYQKEGYEMFNTMVANISREITRYALIPQFRVEAKRESVFKNTQTNQGTETKDKIKKPKVRKNKNQRNMPWR